MDENERQRKLEAGRAKLASYQKKRAKGSGAGAAKKTQKGKGQDVPAQNDRPTQDCHVEAAPPSPNSNDLNGKTKHEVDQKPKKNKVKQKKETDSSPSPDRSPFPLEHLKDEDLVALTGKEQLKLLQQAVEKRNEIISKLSANLQEALASRDQVQLEAQSLTGQIQALQRQLQQTSMEFSRIKSQHPLHGRCSSDSDSSIKEAPLTDCKNVEGSNTDSDEETTTVVKKLKLELQNEKEKSQSIYAELQKERNIVLLLEDEKKEWEDELKRNLMQLQDLQSQCLEMQQYKREKERLNMEVLELRKRLQEEGDAEKRFSEEAASSAHLVQSLEEELESVRKQLEDREKELKFREEEVMGLKASKNRQNQARAGFTSNELNSGDGGDGNLEVRSSEDSMNVSLSGDVLMERYLSSEPPACSQSSLVNESFEQCSQLDMSGDCSFELNSEVLDDHALLSISNRPEEVNDNVLDICSPAGLPDLPAADPPNSQSLFQWLNNSSSDKLDMSQTSEHSGDAHLEKDLLYQQCGELHEELAQKDRDLIVLRDEVSRSAEELEEARSRWAQVTEELREALLELEEEKEKRIQIEEEIQLKSQEQDELQNKLCALLEEKGQAEVREVDERALLEEPQDLLVFSPQETKRKTYSAKQSQGLEEDHLQTFQDLCNDLKSELEDNKKELKTATDVVDLRTVELENALKELQTTQSELLNVQTRMEELRVELDKSLARLDQAEKEKSDLESRIVCLSQNVANLEETQVKALEEKEAHRRKEEEMDDRINKMEQVLEEELEQFENLLKFKDAEMAEEREKWEEERQEKEKELSDVRNLLEEHKRRSEKELKELMEKQNQAVDEATEMVRKSYQLELSDLKEKHEQETSELKALLETRLLEQQVTLEEEQKRQINLIKQVTEREHERMIEELTTTHTEELEKLRTELTLELRESMEAAHQVEMQQAQAQKMVELEALRLSLTNVHQSHLELSHVNLQDTVVSKIQASMKETFTQERALLLVRHQVEVDQMRLHNQEEHERLRQLHLNEMDKLKQQLEEGINMQRASLEEKASKEIQSHLEKPNTVQSDLQMSLSEMEKKLSSTQAKLDSTLTSLAQTNKALSETQTALSQAQLELQESHAKLEDLQTSSKEENLKLAEELKQVLSDRDAAARLLEELVGSHKVELQEKELQLLNLQDKQGELQQEILNLQKEKTLQKQNSQEEVGQLWTQLESMRTSRQELGELKEQLRARSSQVEDIERLKVEFKEQKREIKEQNEAELESLRRYFEQRLRAAEEGYREEIALLQLRIVEGALEESVLKTTNDSFSEFSKCLTEEENDPDGKREELFDSMRHQLEEKHTLDLADLRSSISESFKEELQQVRSDLTDQYYKELQEMKTRHALEMEQLKAKLSEGHLRALTRLQLEAARQTEVEVEQRMWSHSEELRKSMTIIHTLESRLSALSNQHKADMQSTLTLKEDFAAELAHLEDALQKEREQVQERMTTLREELRQKHESELCALREEFRKEKACLEKALQKENNKLKSLQAAIDSDNGPQVLKVRQRLEAQFENELQKTKKSMEEEFEEKLQKAEERFMEEKAALEHHLSQKYRLSLAEVKDKHKAELAHEKATALTKHSQEMDALTAKYTAQLGALSTSHRDQLAAMVTELQSKHNAELVALEAALHSQRKLDLASLEAAFQETSQAQLEAQEAELERKHQEERDELERRMLGNMDTLESTYLKEVQTLRDEMIQIEERHCQDLIQQKSDHERILERTIAEQLSLREELSKELTQMHMEKIGAMTAELMRAHKIELSAQKEALDAEHCQALEALKKQVLELEQQHSAALQELMSTYAAENRQLTEQHQVQLQELKNISARELEACRRELEEESSRQRQQFTEEVELLKVQSEERLQDRINQLKTAFEEQKEAELEELRRGHTSDQEEKERSYTSKMSQLTAQLQQLDAVVAQLREEVGCLQGELEGKRSEMETLDTLLQRRERESQEGGNLLKMLTNDLQAAKEEKSTLLTANEKLKRVVVEMVRGTIATEELIGQKISGHGKISTEALRRRSSTGNKNAQESVADLSSEDLELTHTLCESLLVSDTNLTPGGEEAALSAGGRLHRTVGTLLDLLNQANSQLEETHNMHRSLEEKFSQGRDDSAQFIEQHKLLIEQLNEEAKQKSQLQLELHKAEGLLQGFVAEKAILEESLQQKEAQEERLAEELEGLKLKLHQMQNLSSELEMLRSKNQELSEEHALLQRQKEHLTADLNEREKALLAEVEHLAQDRLDLQRQAEKDHSSLSQRIRALERELEDQETKGLETEQHHKTHTDDLHQRVQALEKQLKHNRQFIEEQAVEREHERDEFQQEIKKLETQLRQTAGIDNKGLKMENLQAIIKDKTEDHATLLAANQQAQRDLAERNEEIDKLAGRIRELEQALLNSAETSRTVNQLEQELHKAMLREQELTQDKQALEQQQLANRLQISALQSKLDETRHCYQENTHDPTQELRDALDTAQQNLQSKEQEVEVLLGQLETVQRDMDIKEAELKHLTLQLEVITNQNTAQVNELEEQIVVLKENVSALTILQEEKEEKTEDKDAEEDTFPSALLLEKNLEIDQLNNEIQRLEQELEHDSENKDLEIEELRSQVEDLRSQVEHLQSEILRVRQDKQEEEERLHEVISTLQAELATLGPNLHEVSDSQDGDSINPSPAPSPEPQHYTIQEQEKKARPRSLKHELGVSHSASMRSLRTRLKGLQSQLETVVAEKEGLERLLHTQEEEYRGHGEEFGKRLKVEMEKAEKLQSLLNRKETELEQLKTHVEEQEERFKAAEDQMDSCKTEAQNVDALHEEIDQLNSLVAELQSKEKERLEAIESVKTKEQEIKLEMSVLRETSLTLERQIQEGRAELVDMEALVAEERAKVKTLETAKDELFAERDALRRREADLQEEIERLKQEVATMRERIQELMDELEEKETSQEEEKKEVLSHAELTLAKADAVLREKEVEHQALREELNTVKHRLGETTQRAEKLQEEAQSKDQALADLESYNQQLKAELQTSQEDLAAQEEELAHQQRELQKLRQRYQHDIPPCQQTLTPKDSIHRAFEDVITNSHGEVSLSSPEVLRRLECSEDRFPERLHTSVLESRLSELSALNSSALELPPFKTSPRIIMEPAHSRTITPDPVSRSSQSLQSGSNYSTVDSLDTDKVQELDGLDLTTPSSPLGSTSSLSAPEWASDGYGSNVSSELGARLRVELEQTERLDAQFVEYLRCRGINPTVNTDSAAGSMSYSEELLSPELQALLRKVYQESCRILTLSQRHQTSRLPGSDLKVPSPSQIQQRSVDGSPGQDESNPPMSWQQEKRALQETVIALRELLCRMAQRHNNADGSGQLQDGHIELQLRAELEERQKEVQRAHNIQQEQKNKIQTLRVTVEEGEEALRRERSKVQMLQQELEQERTRSLRKDIEDGERREAEHVSSEQQRSEFMALKGQVEQEKVTCSNLRRELQIEQSRSMLLEKHLDDIQKELEKAHQHSAHQQDVSSQEKSHLEHLLNQAESRLVESHSKLADAHRKLDEERSRSTRQLDELSRRHETDAARDRKFISDLRAQLDQERRQSEELASVVDRLRAELLQSRRKWEEEERAIREEMHREQEAAARQRVALESLKEQKQDACNALEAEKSLSKRQGAEITELKEKLHLMKSKEREREEQWERERRKGRQEQMEREKRQQSTHSQLCELELLRQQDQQRLQELQRTLAELEREEREMATQRLAGQNGKVQTDSSQHSNGQHNQQASSVSSSSGHMEKLSKENSELREQLTLLRQERTVLKQKITALSQQLRRTENELVRANSETENRPVNDTVTHTKFQRLYERYLRAESFRKALVYQKRYLLLLIGGFQQCEQATLCLIASMGARPSPHPSTPLRAYGRFRVAVRVVIAVSRMKFLTRKWQKAIRRVSLSGSINGPASGSKADILRQQKPNLESSTFRETVTSFVPPSKPSFRLHNRSLSSSTLASVQTGATSLDPERSLTEYIQHLEKVQHRLAGVRQGSPVLQPDPKK